MSEITRELKKNPVIMEEALCFFLMEKAKAEFDEFLIGIEGEFSSKEKIDLMQGFIVKQKEFWEDADEEETMEAVSKIMKIYKHFLKLSLKKKKGRIG